MKMKGIRELQITDVVLVTGLLCVQSDWQGKGKQYDCSSPHKKGIQEEQVQLYSFLTLARTVLQLWHTKSL